MFQTVVFPAREIETGSLNLLFQSKDETNGALSRSRRHLQQTYKRFHLDRSDFVLVDWKHLDLCRGFNSQHAVPVRRTVVVSCCL